MQRAGNRAKFTAIGGLTATVVWLFVAAAPGMAASGVDVDRSADHLYDHEVDKLNLDVGDHGLANPISSDTPDVASERTPQGVSMTPRVETILRQIFDEAAPSDQESMEATPAGANSASSINDLTGPGLEERSADIADAEIVDSSDGDEATPDARLPGLLEEETLQFRRQMFRTDI